MQRLLQKVCVLQQSEPFTVLRRYLTQQEISTALRPFYFAVHPDLFTQYPEQRLVNEESLKILNSHVESLVNKQRHLQSKRVSFYVRKHNETSLIRPAAVHLIHIPLETSDVRTAVSRILRACNLSTEYVDGLKPAQPTRPDPDWSEGTIPNPEVVTPKPELHLSTWIRKNIERAQQLHQAVEPIITETERMRTLLLDELKLTDVRWASNWGLSNYHGCLKRFHAMTQEQRNEPWVEGLCGHTLVFGNETGVTARGEIILSSDDVPQDWVNVLRSMRRYDELLDQLPELEAELSQMLNGLAVVRRRYEAVVMADKYVRNLERAIYSLQCDLQGRVTGDLRHLQLVVEGAAGPLTVSPRGQILVPSSCPGLIMRNFIEQKKLTAARALKNYHKCKNEEEMVINECRHSLSLKSLTKDDHISSVQMTQCCLRLLGDVRQVGVALTGLRLRVSQYYSVMSSGEIIIPWDWKGHD